MAATWNDSSPRVFLVFTRGGSNKISLHERWLYRVLSLILNLKYSRDGASHHKLP